MNLFRAVPEIILGGGAGISGTALMKSQITLPLVVHNLPTCEAAESISPMENN